MKNLKNILWYAFLIFIAYTFYCKGENIPGTLDTAGTVVSNLGTVGGNLLENGSEHLKDQTGGERRRRRRD